MDRHRNRKVRCECSKCRRFTIRGVDVGYKMIDFRTQQAHQRIEENLQRRMSVQLEAFAERDISSDEDLPIPEEDDFEGEPTLHVPMDVEEENIDGRPFNLQDFFKNKIIEVQEVWDSKGMSIEWHNYMLKQLFGHLLPNENIDNVNYKDGIGALIRKMPLDWIDDLEGPPSTPTSFKRLIGLYKKWGLVEPKRWRMCLGTKEYSHEPLILPPAEEDSYDRNKIIKCSCVPPKGKSTCPECATHCTHCGKARTEMIAFHYLPIANQLSSIMESKSLCYKMLTIWRNRHDWLTTTAAPQKIKHFWDGEKVREYQDFWNPRSQWELPITCPNNTRKP